MKRFGVQFREGKREKLDACEVSTSSAIKSPSPTCWTSFLIGIVVVCSAVSPYTKIIKQTKIPNNPSAIIILELSLLLMLFFLTALLIQGCKSRFAFTRPGASHPKCLLFSIYSFLFLLSFLLISFLSFFLLQQTIVESLLQMWAVHRLTVQWCIRQHSFLLTYST